MNEHLQFQYILDSRVRIKMATSFKKTIIKSTPRVGDKVTSDTIYWKNLEVS